MGKKYDFFDELPPAPEPKKESMTTTEQSNTPHSKKTQKKATKKNVLLTTTKSSAPKPEEVILNTASNTDSKTTERLLDLEKKIFILQNLVANFAGQHKPEYHEITKDLVEAYVNTNAPPFFINWLKQNRGNLFNFFTLMINHFKNQN
jgi:hypothetical protein